jgi:hypothetical protein
VILIGLGVLVALLVVAQLVLPSIAADQIRSTLAQRGHVRSVSVSAFPAIKLLWNRADTVKVRMSDLLASVTQSSDLLSRARDTDRLDARIDSVRLGPLTMHNVTVSKRGSRLTASATAAQADLTAALPPGFSVQPVASGNGELVLRASASLFGVGLAANAALEARDGRLVIQPLLPLGGLVSLTVFADPHVTVLGVGATSAPDGYVFSAQATLR